jgi:hypothetical protein
MRIIAVGAGLGLLGSLTAVQASPGSNARPGVQVGVESATKPASTGRVDNLRLQSIDSGPMRGRLVVAGTLDHIESAVTIRDIRVRMTLSVPRRNGEWRDIGQRVRDYRLPAQVSPQNMTLRWILNAQKSQRVERAGDAARLTVRVRETDESGNISTYRKVTRALKVEPIFVPSTSGQSLRSGSIFIPGGYYASDANATYYVWTTEDDAGAPYVGGAGFSGSAVNGYNDYWVLQPLWALQGVAGRPGPGGGYIYMNGSVPSWSYNTLYSTWNPACTDPAMMGGRFSGTSGSFSWREITCGIEMFVNIGPGSVSVTQQS